MKFEMDDKGFFRIVGRHSVGEWASYYGIATLLEDGKLYIAVSAYHESYLPIERVLEITEVSEGGEEKLTNQPYQPVKVKKATVEQIDKALRRGAEKGFWDYDPADLHSSINDLLAEKAEDLERDVN